VTPRSSIVALTFSTVPLICASKSAISNGSRPGMVDSGGAIGEAAVPALIPRNDPPTSPSVSIEATESARTSWCSSSVTSRRTRNFPPGSCGGSMLWTEPARAPDTRTKAPG
jgi:hypothetical protein